MYGGRDDRCHPDADAADDPEQAEHPDIGRQTGAEGTDQEQQRGKFHDRQAADLVRQPSGDQCTERRADQRRGDRDASHKFADLEVVFNRRYGAVDHGAVVAEQQPAKGCDGGYQHYASAVFGFLVVQTRCRITDGSVSHVTPFRSIA